MPSRSLGWGRRLEHFLYNGVAALLASPRASRRPTCLVRSCSHICNSSRWRVATRRRRAGRRSSSASTSLAASAPMTFASLLSEARKFKTHFCLAAQYGEQLHPTVRAAVLGNAGTLMVFRVSSNDAQLLAPEFHPLPAPRAGRPVALHCLAAARRYRTSGHLPRAVAVSGAQTSRACDAWSRSENGNLRCFHLWANSATCNDTTRSEQSVVARLHGTRRPVPSSGTCRNGTP